MSNIEKLEAPSKLLKKLKIPPGNRRVLIRTIQKTSDERTASGIWKIADTEWQPATHADRWGEVMAIPSHLPFRVKEDLMPWQTTVEISVGMRIWYDFLASENCVTYFDENNNEYKLINYEDCYVATMSRQEGEENGLQISTDGDEFVIPLNGFHIFERVYHEKKGKFDVVSETKIDNRYGIVKYVANNNNAYDNEVDEDHVRLKRGDKVMFSTVPAVTLEDEAHCHFDGGRMYRRAQARNVDVVWRDGEIILPNGRVLIKQVKDEKVTKSGIILLKENVKTHTGDVVVSSNEEVPVGSRISYIKGSGMLIDYKGEEHRVLYGHQILYVFQKCVIFVGDKTIYS